MKFSVLVLFDLPAAFHTGGHSFFLERRFSMPLVFLLPFSISSQGPSSSLKLHKWVCPRLSSVSFHISFSTVISSRLMLWMPSVSWRHPNYIFSPASSLNSRSLCANCLLHMSIWDTCLTNTSDKTFPKESSCHFPVTSTSCSLSHLR